MFVCSLLEGQTDVERKAVLAPRPPLHGTHDSVAAAGDHHEALSDHFARKIRRHFAIGESSALRAEPKTATFRKCLNGAKTFAA